MLPKQNEFKIQSKTLTFSAFQSRTTLQACLQLKSLSLLGIRIFYIELLLTALLVIRKLIGLIFHTSSVVCTLLTDDTFRYFARNVSAVSCVSLRKNMYAYSGKLPSIPHTGCGLESQQFDLFGNTAHSEGLREGTTLNTGGKRSATPRASVRARVHIV